jgi:hypothetical protein
MEATHTPRDWSLSWTVGCVYWLKHSDSTYPELNDPPLGDGHNHPVLVVGVQEIEEGGKSTVKLSVLTVGYLLILHDCG